MKYFNIVNYTREGFKMIKKLLIVCTACLTLFCLFGCASVNEGLYKVGNEVLKDSYYFGYYDFKIDESENYPTLNFYVVDDLPYSDSEFDFFIDLVLNDVEMMITDYYNGPKNGVIYIKQEYNNGYCSSRFNLDEGYLNTVCKREGLFD